MIKRLLSTSLVVTGLAVSASAQDKTAPAKAATAELAPAAQTDPNAPISEQIDMSKIGYLIGRSYGENLKRQFVDAKLDDLVRGLKSAMEGVESEIPEAEASELMNAFRPIHGKYVARQRQLAAYNIDEKGWNELATKNKEAGAKFLAENGKKEGVKTTASGLQYEVLREGTGEIPKLTDKVNAIYKGTLLDGTVFDDSKGAPRPFGVSRVVKGWQEALQMMPVGSKWRLTVPSDLAYGPDGNRPPIGPSSTLVFEMELASIKKPVQAVTPPVGINIPPRAGTTPAKPRKRITATTPPVTVPIPKRLAPKTEVKKPEAK
ncbi:MAG: FKBP-type peptidyl-prolyl cis-trans isomerase [Verrucomicrobiales bacterium]|jgi:FKBP-type peptidyl-prolyl cis-trans isomerase